MCHNHLCHKTKNAFLFPGRDINTYLQSLGSGYGRESRVEISTAATALKEDQDYLVCHNLRKYIVDSAKSRKRKSDWLNPEATTQTSLDTINRLTVVFEDEDIGVHEEYHIFHNDPPTMFDDDAEEVKVEKNKSRIGHCWQFPQDILGIGY